MPFAFEKLQVYQKAIAFADHVCTLTRDLPRGYFFLGDPLNRAALSIAANIAEGNGRFTKADRRNFFGIARGSVQECVPLLELAARQKLLPPETPRNVVVLVGRRRHDVSESCSTMPESVSYTASSNCVT